MADEYPPHRNFRIDPKKWDDFGLVVGARKRSQWITDFVESTLHAPQAWRDFRALAESRGDPFSGALTKAIRLYRDTE